MNLSGYGVCRTTQRQRQQSALASRLTDLGMEAVNNKKLKQIPWALKTSGSDHPPYCPLKFSSTHAWLGGTHRHSVDPVPSKGARVFVFLSEYSNLKPKKHPRICGLDLHHGFDRVTTRAINSIIFRNRGSTDLVKSATGDSYSVERGFQTCTCLTLKRGR